MYLIITTYGILSIPSPLRFYLDLQALKDAIEDRIEQEPRYARLFIKDLLKIIKGSVFSRGTIQNTRDFHKVMNDFLDDNSYTMQQNELKNVARKFFKHNNILIMKVNKKV